MASFPRTSRAQRIPDYSSNWHRRAVLHPPEPCVAPTAVYVSGKRVWGSGQKVPDRKVRFTAEEEAVRRSENVALSPQELICRLMIRAASRTAESFRFSGRMFSRDSRPRSQI